MAPPLYQLQAQYQCVSGECTSNPVVLVHLQRTDERLTRSFAASAPYQSQVNQEGGCSAQSVQCSCPYGKF